MSAKQENILVIKLGALGDFVQALGPMKAIRSYHLDAKISLLTTKSYSEFAENSGYFDNILIDSRPKFYNLKQWLSLKKLLNSKKFTRVYDLQNNDRTGFYFKLLNPKPEWVGIAKGASHRNTSLERTAGLAFEGHKQTLSSAGIEDIEIDTMEWIKNDISHLNLKSPYALIIPGCAPTRPEKRWPITNYISLCDYLIRKNIQPVLIGTNDEKTATEQIAKSNSAILNLTGKTSLFDIVPLARKATLAIGNDTGPMHLIAPTGCKTIVLFSANSNPNKHAPLGKNVITLQKDKLTNLATETVIQSLPLLG
jgi:ADP-heptose:LPS heptosyltransferase